ncbi:MAG TPA: hypothetical protein VK963_01385 [Candidatus Saccharimonadales bacterium]|nr:hypothetical protein [Candidatus Saccharimonadales bacterium]
MTDQTGARYRHADDAPRKQAVFVKLFLCALGAGGCIEYNASYRGYQSA